VWVALSSPDNRGRLHPKLESFLLDPYVLTLLARPFNPYSFTSAQSKTAFETKTAAINVTPTTKKGYDINEIKEDALWLSKEAEIDEISALRITVLEYQSRGSAQILSDFSDEEAVSLQQAAGDVNAEFSTAIPRAMLSSGKPAPFESRESRRVRTLQLYLQECRCLLKCAGYFVQVAFSKDDNDFFEGILQSVLKIKGKRNGKEKYNEDLLELRVGEALAGTLVEAGTSAHKLLLDSIKSLKAGFERLQRGSGWFREEAGHEALEMDWLNNKLVENLHIMEIIFRLVDRPAHVPSAEAVLAWFRFVSSYGFFDRLETVSRIFPYEVFNQLTSILATPFNADCCSIHPIVKCHRVSNDA
jgi:nuclear pore complex protein Nup188